MSLQAELIDSDGERVNVYAHADSNYVWVDYAHLVDEDTVFNKQEVYGDNEVKSDKTYRLRPHRVSVSKYQMVEVSLDSLDAVPFEITGFYVFKYFKKTEAESGLIDYQGIYIADKNTFKLTHKKTWDDDKGFRVEVLQGDEYAYTTDEIMNAMIDDSNSFDLYMPQGSYQITKQALENPNDKTAVKTKVESLVSLSEMQGLDLFCVENCISADNLEKTFNQAKQGLSRLDKEKDYLVLSPYVKLDRPKKEDLVKYKFEAGNIYNGGKQIFKDDLITGLLDPANDFYDQLESIKFSDDNYYYWSIAWGLGAGFLVDSSDIKSFKCSSIEEDSQTPDQYCPDNFWESKEEIKTYYAVRYEIEPSFELLTENKQPVEFMPAKTLYYTVPEGESRDAGNRFALEYFGQGQLLGIPGYVYDTLNGSDKGEYSDDWKDSYRYLDRFTIPDGGELVDDEGKKYKVKALFGEEWLKKAPDFRGKYSYSGNKEQLPSDDQLFIKDGFDALDTIGPMPTDKIINDGKPSVIHGEIIYDPTPNAK